MTTAARITIVSWLALSIIVIGSAGCFKPTQPQPSSASAENAPKLRSPIYFERTH